METKGNRSAKDHPTTIKKNAPAKGHELIDKTKIEKEAIRVQQQGMPLTLTDKK